MTFVKEESAGYLVNLMGRRFAMALQEELQPLGLSVGQFPALLVLWEEEGLTQRDLVERLQIEQATMANTLARMERDGLVLRKKDAADGRMQRIFLTQQARDLQAQAVGAAEGVNEKMLSNLRPGQRRRFMEFLKILSGVEVVDSDD